MATRRGTGATRRGGWGSTLAIMGALGVLALALFLVPRALLPPPAASSGPSSGPSSEPTVEPSVSFTPSAYQGVEWELYRMSDKAEGFPAALTEIEGRLVAVGTDGEGPAAWWSDDGGRTWTATAMAIPGDPPSEGASVVPAILAAGPDGLLATGFWMDPTQRPTSVVAWTSADGRAWDPATLSGLDEVDTLAQVLGDPDGYHATGYSPTSAMSWWQSDDGLSWQPIEPLGFDASELGPAVVARGTLAVVTGGGLPAGSSIRPAIYASIDWTHWEEAYRPDDLYGRVQDIASFEEGFVAVGLVSEFSDLDHDGRFGAWISYGGYAWQLLPVEAPPGSAGIMVAANADGAVSIGWPDDTGGQAAWFLPHGGSASTTALPMFLSDLVAMPDRFFAIGTCGALGEACGPLVAIGTPAASVVTTAPTLPPLPD